MRPALPVLDWPFPLDHALAGVHLANGTLGLLVWGEDRLSLTLGRTGFWDHRGTSTAGADLTFAQIRTLLLEDRIPELKTRLARASDGLPWRGPTQLPGGRLDLTFPNRARPVRSDLDLASGTLAVTLSDGARVLVRLDPASELAWLDFENTAPASVTLVPSHRALADLYTRAGIAAPVEETAPASGSAYQPLPADPGLALAWSLRSPAGPLVVAAALDTSATSADAPARACTLAQTADLDAARTRADAWWSDYWRDTPRLDIPDPALSRAWYYGLWKQAGLTPPQGIPATLQGAWMDDAELPPWSNDYHFNINLQMIYWPALVTNRAAHLDPLWHMLRAWLPALRENGRRFFGADDALHLSHCTDDRGNVIGAYWQGLLDQACPAWIGLLAWEHYRYTLDLAVLRDIAWPLLSGAFGGYWTMLESSTDADGRPRLSLPVSVSPEFGGWGRDASFQLAALHLLADLLPRAADLLGYPHDPRWARIRAELPAVSVARTAKVWGVAEPQPRIGVWADTDLPESHRHHSHLAAIYPFRTLDPLDPEHTALAKRSLEHFVALGPGNWVGWSMPWAAQIWARANEASATVTLLRIWDDVFTNPGGASLHNADSTGYSGWIYGPFLDGPGARRAGEQVQLDASLGAVSALAEICVQERRGVLHVLPALPKQWRDFAFDGLRAPGAFLVSAAVRGHRVVEIQLHSLADSALELALPPSPSGWSLDGAPLASTRLSLPRTEPGSRLVLRPACGPAA